MTTKPYTIPDEYEREATLSAWLRCYPFMAKNARKWGLHRVPVSERCKALYPDLIATLHAETRPKVINFAVSSKEAIAA